MTALRQSGWSSLTFPARGFSCPERTVRKNSPCYFRAAADNRYIIVFHRHSRSERTMYLLCQVRQILILLLILVIGIRALIPGGHELCFKSCGEIALAAAHGPHGCDHDDETPACARHAAHQGHDDGAESSPLKLTTVAPIHPTCTDLSAGELVVDRYRAEDSTPFLSHAALWSSPAPTFSLENNYRGRHRALSIPRVPSPDAYFLPLRI